MDVAATLRRSADGLLAVGLAAAIGLALLADIVAAGEDRAAPVEPATVFAAAVAIALAISLAWRRRRPEVALGLAVVTAIAATDAPMDAPVPVVLALVVTTYSVGAHTTGRAALVGALGVAVLVAIAAARDLGPDSELNDLAVPLLVLGMPWLAGISIGTRTEREAALERVHLEQANQAAAAARTRIARDLHDSVAHAMSVVVLQARGARRVLADDPRAAREALDVIESTGTDALAEMRTIVGALREPDEAVDLGPPPSLRQLDPLLARVRDAGLPVRLTIEGEPVTLPPGMDAAAYRIVQEALTNALAHAGRATASVLIRYEPDRLELEIGDTGFAATRSDAGRRTAGHGLEGMRERVARFDGHLETGPRPEGGFVVHADLPFETGHP